MPPKDMEMRDAILYIMNEDGTEAKFGEIASVDETIDVTVDEPAIPIEKLGGGEIELKATIDLDGWKRFIRKYAGCNNYRKMLGLPMKRRKSLEKARKRRLNSILRRWFGSVKYGEHVFKSIDIDAAMRICFPIVEEE